MVGTSTLKKEIIWVYMYQLACDQAYISAANAPNMTKRRYTLRLYVGSYLVPRSAYLPTHSSDAICQQYMHIAAAEDIRSLP